MEELKKDLNLNKPGFQVSRKCYTKLCLFSAWSPRNVGIVFLNCPWFVSPRSFSPKKTTNPVICLTVAFLLNQVFCILEYTLQLRPNFQLQKKAIIWNPGRLWYGYVVWLILQNARHFKSVSDNGCQCSSIATLKMYWHVRLLGNGQENKILQGQRKKQRILFCVRQHLNFEEMSEIILRGCV